jgi:hypothetical protein
LLLCSHVSETTGGVGQAPRRQKLKHLGFPAASVLAAENKLPFWRL